MGVVVRLVLEQHGAQVPFVEDQQSVQTLAADRPDPAPGVGVGSRRLWWAAQRTDACVGEHRVEAGGEPRVAVAGQEPQLLGMLGETTNRLRACRVTHSPVG